MSGPGSASDSQGAYNVAYVAALRSEQNKRHRKRLQSAEAQVESELEELAAEVAAARREGAALDVVHRSLIATERHQCDMLQVLQLADLQAARAGVERPARRPQVAAPAAAGLKAGLMHVVSEWSARAAALVQKGAYAIVTWGGYVPTDADMRRFLLASSDEEVLNRLVRNQGACADLLARWQSGAEGVAEIEAGVRQMCGLRSRFILSLARHRPELLWKLTGKMTPAPPGAGGGAAAKPGRRRLHSSLQFVADLDWSEAQREALRPRWALYQEQVASCRILAQYHLRGLQKDTATAVATWAAAETLPQLMESYAGVFDNAAGLDAWLRLEATAWADLAAFLCTVLTPYQTISIAANSRPYIADFAQIVGWVVDGGEGRAAEGAAAGDTAAGGTAAELSEEREAVAGS